jgi:hypothetical protein
MENEEGRRRLSWREIDKLKDRSKHLRREKRPSFQEIKRSREYKRRLDQLFNQGKIGKILKSSSPKSSQRQKLLKNIREAITRDEITKSIDKFLQFYELPNDIEILTQVLSHKDEGIVQKGLLKLKALLSKERPQRIQVLKERLFYLQENAKEEETRSYALSVMNLIS